MPQGDDLISLWCVSVYPVCMMLRRWHWLYYVQQLLLGTATSTVLLLHRVVFGLDMPVGQLGPCDDSPGGRPVGG